MAQPHVQTTFETGEWAPKLRSRVDSKKYQSGAALMRNFFVDYSGGGASTRQGTRFINQCKSPGARLVPFQPSVSISYVLEFGANYIRFYTNGAPVLEAAITIQSISGSPVTVNSTANGYANGDWVFISGAYYIVVNATTNTYQLTDLFGNNITSLSGTQAQRVYTITSPFVASDLFPNQGTGNPGIKWAQDVTSLIITHPSYNPQILTINSATNWTLSAIAFGPSVAAPSNANLSLNIGGSGWFYSYKVTAVDNNGQESVPSAASSGNAGLISTVNPSNLALSWAVVPGAVSYNIYKSLTQANFAVPSGAQFGFVGNITNNEWLESYPGVAPDFSQTPPIAASPIVGGTVNSLVLDSGGSAVFSVVPGLIFAAAPAGGLTATGSCSLQVAGAVIVNNGAISNASGVSPLGQFLTFTNGIVAQITSVSPISQFQWRVLNFTLVSRGSLTGAGTFTPTNPMAAVSVTSGWIIANAPTVNFTWNIGSISLTQGGFGYTAAPAVTFSTGSTGSPAAHCTVTPLNTSGASGVLGAAPVGNPRCCSFFQQRLVLAAPNAGLQSFYMSQPGSFFNFNVTNPTEADNGIFGSIISEELNAIKSLINVPTGLLALTGKGAWLLNGGGGISTAQLVTPDNVSATPQAFNGANDLRPLKINMDALYVTNKGNSVRDASYNIYANIFTGTDITVLSNHLFFGYALQDWTYAEEPFKVVWAVRSDGILLSLSFVKEQELVGWAHHDTNGFFTSTTSVIETVAGNTTDATYFIVQRLVQGQYLSYVERLADRYFPYGYEDAWSVDCALQTTPSTTITAGNLTVSGSTGSVTLTDITASPFLVGMVGNVVRAGGGIYTITGFTSSSVVTATVTRTPLQINEYTNLPFPQTGYTIWTPVSSVSGLTQLTGLNVVGVVDGSVVGVTSPLVVSGSGTVNLGTTGTKVTLGLAFTPQLQTLPLDLGEPENVLPKRLKISALTLRVADTLGLQAGTTFSTLVTVKDFQLGAIPSTSAGPNQQVVDLVNPSFGPQVGNVVDGRIIIDQLWQEAGDYCIQQNLPYPATILAVVPETTVGDTAK